MTQPSVAIIGAGLTGLRISQRLDNAGIATTIFDKSRGVSGRVATRRVEIDGHTLRFDHGTPSLTASQAAQLGTRSMPTEQPLDLWLTASSNAPEEPHYILANGMNGIGKWLAQDKNVALNSPVTGLQNQHQNRAWQIASDCTLLPEAYDLVITTTPPLQAAKILETTDSALAYKLKCLSPEGCWSLMLVTEHPLDTPPLLTQRDHLIERVISEHTKGRFSNEWGVYTLQANRAWSQRRMQEDPMRVAEQLLNELKHMGYELPTLLYQRMHRWLYAGVATPFGEAFLLDAQRRLMCAGDWCLGNDIESAVKSADAASSAAIELFGHSS